MSYMKQKVEIWVSTIGNLRIYIFINEWMDHWVFSRVLGPPPKTKQNETKQNKAALNNRMPTWPREKKVKYSGFLCHNSWKNQGACCRTTWSAAFDKVCVRLVQCLSSSTLLLLLFSHACGFDHCLDHWTWSPWARAGEGLVLLRLKKKVSRVPLGECFSGCGFWPLWRPNGPFTGVT